jgi:diguanylate cyclase (GGDEF)-like protein
MVGRDPRQLSKVKKLVEMSLVSAEAVKNIKNAAGKMYKILLIDRGDSSIHDFQEILKKKGFTFIKANTFKKAVTYLKKNSFDLIVVDKFFSTGVINLKRFKDLVYTIPKIVITPEHSFKGIGSWANDKLAIPLHEPITYREFEHQIKRLMRDKQVAEENQKLHAELKAKKRELIFFEDVTRILASTLELNKILTPVMKKTKALIGVKVCFVLFVNEEGGRRFFFEKTNEEKLKKIQQKSRVKIAEDITDGIAKKNLSVIIPDVSKDAHFKEKMDKLLRLKTRSLICIPIKIKNKLTGIFVLANKVTGEPFTKTDSDLLSKLVNHAAMAIERASLYQKMQELTITDDLTNLFNYRYLNRAIELEIARSNRYGSPFTLIFMDIDSFKDVNDQHGHLTGSKVLVEMAKLLLNNLRSVDIIARYGGDEFVIVLLQTSMENGFQIAERLRKALEKHVFLKDKGYSIRLTASFGVASYPKDAKTKEELFRIADEAMYRGKFSTKNIVYAAAKQR